MATVSERRDAPEPEPQRTEALGRARADISVIVCAFTMDRWGDLTAALSSVRRQTRPPRELILVVDRSSELLERARETFAGIRILANSHADGLSGARQTGAEAARGSILAYLDDDAVAEPEWLAELEHAHSDESVLGVGGQVAPRWVGEAPRWFPPEFNWVVGCSYDGMPTERVPIRNPIGANMAVRAEVLRRSGQFESAFGRTGIGDLLGGTAEETEFCIRAARLHPGKYFLYSPDAKVHHTVGPARGTWRYFVRRCRVEGRAKAMLTRVAGSERGLASERAYVRSVLPRAIVRELRVAAGGELAGLARAAAIVAGLAVTSWEYLLVSGSCRLRAALSR